MKEKILRALILILFINLSLYSCDRSNDLLNTDIEIQDFVWKGLNAYYLFQQDIDDLSDRRFNSIQELENYLSSFTTPEDIFNSLRTGLDTRSKLIDNYEISNSPLPLRSSFMTGMEFGLFKDPNRLDSIVGFLSLIHI